MKRFLVLLAAAVAAIVPAAVFRFSGWRPGPVIDTAVLGVAAGTNRLLVGVAWPLMAFLHWYRTRQRGIALATVNVPHPLVEPDVQIARIRLSSDASRDCRAIAVRRRVAAAAAAALQPAVGRGGFERGAESVRPRRRRASRKRDIQFSLS